MILRGSITAVLEGRQYNRGVHTLVNRKPFPFDLEPRNVSFNGLKLLPKFKGSI